jgi:hypothetical protein
LQELNVGVRLQFDHVRRNDDFLDFTEIDTFSGSRWHFIFRLSLFIPAPSLDWEDGNEDDLFI